MKRDDILRMAREAFGAPYSSYLEKRSWDINDKQVERFAALVAAAEREQCAQVVDDFGDEWMCDSHELAKIIRARSEK